MKAFLNQNRNSNKVNENLIIEVGEDEEEDLDLIDLTNYLKETDHDLFDDHIMGVLNQITVFEKLINVEKKRKDKILDLEGFLREKRDCANIYDLIDQIKENVFQRENYDHFMLILQYLIMIPNSEDGDQIWETISEFLEKFIYKKEIKVENFFKNKKDSNDEIKQKCFIEMEEKIKKLEEENKEVF